LRNNHSPFFLQKETAVTELKVGARKNQPGDTVGVLRDIEIDEKACFQTTGTRRR
jgi:hypothetical protein